MKKNNVYFINIRKHLMLKTIFIAILLLFFGCAGDDTNKDKDELITIETPKRGAFEHLGLSKEVEEQILRDFVEERGNGWEAGPRISEPNPWNILKLIYNWKKNEYDATIDDFEVVGYYGTYTSSFTGEVYVFLSIQATGYGKDLGYRSRQFTIYGDEYTPDTHYFYLDILEGSPFLLWVPSYSPYNHTLASKEGLTPFGSLMSSITPAMFLTYEDVRRDALPSIKFYKSIDNELVDVQ